MGRLPAYYDAVIETRVPVGTQGMWEVIRDLAQAPGGGLFTVGDIDRRMNTHRQTIQDSVRRWTKAGFLAVVGHREGPTPVPIYQLVIDQPEAPSVRRDGSLARPPGLGQDQMWRAMKMLKRFTAQELAIAASTAEVSVTEATADSYARALERTGYLGVAREGQPGHKPGTGIKTMWRLVRVTGPLAPQILRTEWVWDPNEKKAMGALS